MGKNGGAIFGKSESPSKPVIKNLKLISREYNIGMCCIICNEEKERKTFIIEQKITDDVVYKKEIKINQNICPECFKEDSVTGRSTSNGQITVTLLPYKEIIDAKFWANSKIKREDILFMNEAAQILQKKGIEKSKTTEYLIKIRNPKFIKKMKAPVEGKLGIFKKNYITKQDFESVLNISERCAGDIIKYRGVTNHNLDDDRILELFNLGYVVFGSRGLIRLGNNKTKKNKVCTKCGEIKSWSDFPKSKSCQSHNRCFDCRKNYREKYYQENSEAFKARVKAYRKTPAGKAVRKEWEENNPARKVLRNLRKRLGEVVDGDIKAETKDVGMNTKDVKRYLEKQFVIYGEWMNWDNKGAGENSDHQDCWHVDHLIPISKWKEKKHLLPTYFEGMGPNHYTNLRPLSGIENIARGNKVNPEEIEEHFKKIEEIFPDMDFSQQKV